MTRQVLEDRVFLSLKKEDIVEGYGYFITCQSFNKETPEQLKTAVAGKLAGHGVIPALLSDFKLVGEPYAYEDFLAVYYAGDYIVTIRRGVTYFIDVYEYNSFFNRLSTKLDNIMAMYYQIISLDPKRQKIGESILEAKTKVNKLKY